MNQEVSKHITGCDIKSLLRDRIDKIPVPRGEDSTDININMACTYRSLFAEIEAMLDHLKSINRESENNILEKLTNELFLSPEWESSASYLSTEINNRIQASDLRDIFESAPESLRRDVLFKRADPVILKEHMLTALGTADDQTT